MILIYLIYFVVFWNYHKFVSFLGSKIYSHNKKSYNLFFVLVEILGRNYVIFIFICNAIFVGDRDNYG